MRLVDRVLSDAPNLLPRVTRLAPGLFGRALRRPVFLLGCGRSGKTVLADALGRHPAIALYPGEANRLWHPQLYPWRESPARSEVPPIWADPAEFARGSLARRGPRDADILRGSFGAYQMIRRKPILLNESALIAVLIPYILEHFNRPVLIHFVRDGRAVAPAWAGRQHQPRVRTPFDEAGLDLDFDSVLDRCATSWAWQVTEVRRVQSELGFRARDFLELRYEDFCREPLAVLARICEALDIDVTPLEALDLGYIEDRNAADSAELTPDQLRRIERSMSDALDLFGYDTSKGIDRSRST